MSALDEARAWEAVQHTTCAVCMDRTDDGRCRLPARGAECALRSFFPAVFEIARRVRGETMEPYVDAVEDCICGGCREHAASGACARRGRGECALFAYLPLTVEAVEDALPQPV